MTAARSSNRLLVRLQLQRVWRVIFCLLLLLFSTLAFLYLSSLFLPVSTRIADVPIDAAPSSLRVSSLFSLADALARDAAARRVFERVFEMHTDEAPLRIPPAFQATALSMFRAFGGTPSALLRALEHQRVLEVRNRVTGDAALFNDVRRFRPGGAVAAGGAHYASDGGDACDFCRRDRTAEDVFGRVEGRHAYSASNVAKLSRWHGLVIAAAHDPLAFDADTIADALNVTVRWFRRANRADGRHTHPNIVCDVGPRASASQVHLHLQTALTAGRYMARAAGQRGGRYWADLVAAHAAVGLAVRVGASVVLSHLCPRKERELLVLADDPEDPSFARAVALALGSLRDDAGVRAMSFAMTFPPFDAGGRFRVGEAPAVMRVIDRGSPLDTRSDTGALEYFATTYIAADPYDMIPHLIKRRDRG